jgi:tyrosine-protein kinase Etk/Wzc
MTSDRPIPMPQGPMPSVEEEDEINLGELLSIIWAGRWIVLAAVLVTCFFGLLYLVAAQPVFEADGMVQVEQDAKSMTSSMGDLGSLFGAPMETEAEIQILQSRLILNKVIENLNLEIDAQPAYLPLVGAFIARRRGTGGLVAPQLLGLDHYAWSGESIQVTKFEVPTESLGQTYELTVVKPGEFTLQNPDGNEVLRGQVGTLASVQTGSGRVSIFVRDIQSYPETRFNVVRWGLADVLNQLSNNLKVAEAGKQSGIISLTVEGPTPKFVTSVIQQIEDAYVRQNVERRSAEAEQSLAFLQQQLPEIKGRVDAAQAKLNAYQQKKGSVNVTKETDLVLQQTVDFETKRLELLGQRQQAIQRFTAQHPVVQALDAQIESLADEQANIRKRTELLPETQQEVLSLLRDLDVNSQLYTTLLNSAQELQVAKAGTVGNVRIIDYPLAPNKKTKPKSVLVAAASIFLGLFLGVGYLFVQKALFRGVDRPDEVERLLGLPTYAAVPYTQSQRRLALALKDKKTGSHILAMVEPDNVAIESLRSLRTSLQFALLESANNIVMFTGPTPGLGKSFISVNLGAVLAKGGKKVVVVDCDLRRGHLHRYIGETAAPGMSDYVAGNADLQSAIRKTAIEGMSLVTNGTNPPNPSELLLHERFAQFLDHLSKNFDLVILDTPPVLPVTDASIVGRLAGCVLLILKEGAHPMRAVEETVRRLRQAGVQIRGTIFNQIGQRGGGYGYYYSSYGYTYANKYKSESR